MMYLLRRSCSSLLTTLTILLLITPGCLTLFGIDPIKVGWKLRYGLDVTPDPTTPEPLPTPTKLKTPTIDEAIYYVHYAAASYCHGTVLTDWTCKQCKIIGSSIKLNQVFENDSAGTKGYVAVDEAKQEIILVYRGTNNIMNWIQDFSGDMVDLKPGDAAVAEMKVHHGFYDATMSLYPNVVKALQKLHAQYPTYRIVIVGHSLGGSMGTLTYFFLTTHGLPNVQYALFTYGEPRPGNKPFADFMNSQSIVTARVVNEGDIVPHATAASVGFVHHEREFWTHDGHTRICSNEVYEDLSCSASLPSDEFNGLDHLSYLNVSIGLNCIEENPLGAAWGMLTG